MVTLANLWTNFKTPPFTRGCHGSNILFIFIMVASKYIVAKEIEATSEVLLYHTLSTTLISLPDTLYQRFFLNSDFPESDDVVKRLYELGFLIDDDFNESSIIEKLREVDAAENTQTVTIFSTNNCNARCYYCFEEGIQKNDMSQSTAEQIIKFICSYFPNTKLQIQWFGGEPLMAMDVISYITESLRQSGYQLSTHITTNGSYITQEIIDFFKQNYESTSFQITIDEIGVKYANIKRYVNIPREEAFDHVINACKLVLENNLYLSIRINFLPKKFEEAKLIYTQLYQTFEKNKSEYLRIYMSPITLSEDCSGCSSNEVSSTQFLELLQFQYQHNTGRFTSEDGRVQLLQSFYLKPKSSFCGATRKYNLVITAEGKIYKCHRFVKYKGDKYVVGDIWKGVDEGKEAYRDFSDTKIKDVQCRNCRALPICQEGCFAVRKLYGKDRICSMSERLEECLMMYWEAVHSK